jgi:asparagine synthase (glutamine-hydrolysing)
MSNALVHRGPDGEGYVLHGPGRPLRAGRDLRDDAGPGTATVGLAHRRLAIIDLTERSDQPMIDERGRCSLVYNGEIYNYLEVRAELERSGHRFRTTGDTEVVLNAYLEWGPDCVQRFVGMWAFALLDLERQSLLLSRDRFGIKPLFYAVVRGELRFASEIKGLLAAQDFAVEPNDDVVRRFMLIGQVDVAGESFFRDIFQLPPAHQAVVPLDAPSVIRPQRYWELPDPTDVVSTANAPERLEALLRDSVRLHARSDVPVGTCLSGGLDSSAIVCEAELLRQQGQIPSFAHHGFGYVPQDPAHSERRHMDVVTRKTQLEMTYVDDDPGRVLDVIPSIARQQDEPFGTASIVAQWFVFESAARAGLKVMLDGQGADEVLGGYHTYLPMIARAHLRRWRLLRYAQLAAEHRKLLGAAPLTPLDAVASAVPAVRRVGDGRARALTPAAALLSPGFRGAWHRADEGALAARSINEILRRATTLQLPALLRFEDRNSMAHSIEARVPFLDHRLVEFAFRLPGDQKIHGVVTKHVLREALVGILPEPIRARTDKVGFRADPGITWTFAARHRDVLVRSGTRFEDRWFDRGALERLIDTTDRTQENEYALWRAISLKLWLAANWSDQAAPLEGMTSSGTLG